MLVVHPTRVTRARRGEGRRRDVLARSRFSIAFGISAAIVPLVQATVQHSLLHSRPL
ncbi:hypothetical protein BCR37DRAFT_380413 [Protomyces lactucae-debilis]|uniref:Uncharacterized protein n=1 Tax=Protomyces lactucae-debilis TaxID=2754530 RepID=A0A1Y2FC71_PROLT|nr:uncharacterized protein BCR37DRAFT_380413 [Protomyces lactucae-debilis]ORY81512.1 hypothetical protein BCR37DRAFT_380413 [Protomyces lactucae-debilis]